MSRIFICYRDDNTKYRNDFAGLIGGNHTSSDIPVIDRENFRGTSQEEIRKYLNKKIGQCSALVLLVGNRTHNGPWVLHEINVALSRGMKIIAVRIPETNGGLPKILKQKNIQILKWDGKIVQNEIDRLFGR